MTSLQQSNEIEKLMNKKREIGVERDLCAELYNVWISKLHDHEDDPEKYELYLNLIANMEPYGNMLKEQIRELNRQICEIEGVESIAETKYEMECVYKYGFDRPEHSE